MAADPQEADFGAVQQLDVGSFDVMPIMFWMRRPRLGASELKTCASTASNVIIPESSVV